MKENKKNLLTGRMLKVGLVIAIVAVWAAVPFISDHAAAGGVPVLVRSGNLVSPTGSVNPHGFSEYQLYANGHREIEVEIQDLAMPAGTSLSAVVDGFSIGQFVLGVDLRGRLKLRTEDGQQVPVTNDGSVVQVLSGQTVLLAGVLSGGGPNPGPTSSPTATPTGSPTSSPTATPTASPTASPTGSPSPSPTGTPEPGFFAGLTGPTIGGVVPMGYAEFEIHSSRVELEVRLRQINLPAGTSLSVIVDNTAAGNLFVESDREGELRLRSDRGEVVPPVAAGSTIQIRNGGTTILNGVFAGFAGPSPSPTGTPGPTPSPSPQFGRSFEAHLLGSGVTPPVQTAANGEIKVTLNAAEDQAVIFGEYHNLSSGQTSARIEVLTSTVTTVHTFQVLGGHGGNFAPVTISVTAAQVQQLRAGLWSAVIASSNNPGGEIRGQLIQRSSESDFDGDGSNDFAVYRPSTGTWYSQNNSGFSALSFGSSNDKVVSADYDGDGKTDSAVFRNVNGSAVWEIKRSSDGGITGMQFGFATDTPTRGDFDGDGRSDIAVYRASTGNWFIQNSQTGSYTILKFGIEEDRPLPADIDGDGRDDIMVFRPSTGVWYWQRSSDGGYGAVKFGLIEDIPVRGDFDGDGKADISVFRPSTGVWYSQRSSDGGYLIQQFGLAGDIPVAGNYDADGKTDIAVFRPSDGHWYILRSTDGSFMALPFGLNGDIPVIAR